MAGNGEQATIDGTGTDASLWGASGIEQIGGHVYIASRFAIRVYDIRTGDVSTLAGSGTPGSGCADSQNPAEARFGPNAGLVTDGMYLYTISDCGETDKRLRRIEIATGATSTLLALNPNTCVACLSSHDLVMAPDGHIYVTAPPDAILRVNPGTGSSSTFANVPSGVWSIAADASHLWVVGSAPTGNTIYKIALVDGSVSEVVTSSSMSPGGALAVDDSDVYVSGEYDGDILRYPLAGGSVEFVVGSGTGGANGLRDFELSDGALW
ncbi:MAG: hypothetical protein ACRDJP_04600, partial [Actinomycetota bacterium]